MSAWREKGEQRYLGESALAELAECDGIALTPRLFTIDAAELPAGLEETRAFLAERLPRTQSALDTDAGGVPEGIVLRATDRSVISKARFKDYDRTLKRRRSSRNA